jgi:hypothetical protein
MRSLLFSFLATDSDQVPHVFDTPVTVGVSCDVSREVFTTNRTGGRTSIKFLPKNVRTGNDREGAFPHLLFNSVGTKKRGDDLSRPRDEAICQMCGR